jgi:uncharacterized membrane protein (UPF0127 family)
VKLHEVNPFKALPLLLAVQIAAGVMLGGPAGTTVAFPDSDAQIRVEVADSPEEREKGLMYVRNLPVDQGMLFVFSDEEYRGFWMKNTYIPLDIIFVNSKNRIVDIDEAVPQPNASEEELKTYRSDEPAKYVIETNSTFTERKDVEEGDRVEIPTRY